MKDIQVKATFLVKIQVKGDYLCREKVNQFTNERMVDGKLDTYIIMKMEKQNTNISNNT